MRQSVLSKGKFAEYCNENAIALIGHSGSTGGAAHEPEKVRDRKTGEEIEQCPKYPGLTCEEHQDVYKDTRGKFNFRGTPASFVCSPDGADPVELKSRGAKDMIEALETRQKKLGPGLRRSEFLQIQGNLAKGDEYRDQGNAKDAIKYYEKVTKLEGKAPGNLPEVAKQRLEELNAQGLRAIEEAKDLDPVEARKALTRIQRDYKGLPCSDEAKEAMKELEDGE